MYQDCEQILFTPDEIATRVAELGAELTKTYHDQYPVIVTVMTGAAIFTADLIRQLNFPISLDYIDIASYGSSSTSHNVRLLRDLATDITDRPVIIVEDIIDTGNSLQFLLQHFANRGAKSIVTCAMLDKPDRRKVDLEADYVGFKVPDEFIVGYGLDYNHQYRNLPAIAILKHEIYD